MKNLDGMKCPHCGGKNTTAVTVEAAHVFDTKKYPDKDERLDPDRLLDVTDNIVYECKCDDCKNRFYTMAVLNIDIIDIIPAKTIGAAMGAKR